MFFHLLFLVSYLVLASSHPYDNLTMIELIELFNYPVETHTVETPDQYILELQRIPHGTLNHISKEVVLLVHGLGGGAENFITIGPPDALAFYLSDRGYDVWLFNARGTAHSRAHRTLDPYLDRNEFWEFSWNEIGIFDLPTSINYILNTTGKESIFYVGHSQGTTSFFVMLSERPEMNDKIRVAGLLAPSVFLNFTQDLLLKGISSFYPIAESALDILSYEEFLVPNSPELNEPLKNFCSLEVNVDLCLSVLYAIGGTVSGYVDRELITTIVHFSPTGFSPRQLWHYAQIMVSGEFKQYDFGLAGNILKYNRSIPPFYNLTNVKAPIGLFWAKQDRFANEKMVQMLVEELPNVTLVHEVLAENFNHLDFIFANNVRQEVHEPLYELFQQFEETG